MTPNMDQERLLEVLSGDEDIGFCVECGEECDRVEPDARNYKCHACGNLTVYGAEQILVEFDC